MLTVEARFTADPRENPDLNQRRNQAILEGIELAGRIASKVRVLVDRDSIVVAPGDALESVLARLRATPAVRHWIGEPVGPGYRGESGPIRGEQL